MKVFLSAFESLNEKHFKYIKKKGIKLPYLLSSFYYYSSFSKEAFSLFCELAEEILIDSGAHSFQKGVKIDYPEYTRKYARFIQEHSKNPKFIGFFEMDIDNQVGYKNVLKMRDYLHRFSDRIVPVWHKNRGLEDFKSMCHEYSGKLISIPCLLNKGIKEIVDEDLQKFVDVAHAFNCQIHGLGMTRKKTMEKVNFDSVDSSSWIQSAVHGNVYYGKYLGKKKKIDNKNPLFENFTSSSIPAELINLKKFSLVSDYYKAKSLNTFSLDQNTKSHKTYLLSQ